jgi:hypothetical protein
MTSITGKNAIISKSVAVICFDNIFEPRLSNCSNCWLPVETVAKAMAVSGHVDASLVNDARSFNIAMSRRSAIGAVMADLLWWFESYGWCPPYIPWKIALLLLHRSIIIL